MRILHVTDFHFRLHWFDWLLRHGPAHDAVCFTGDLLDMFPSSSTSLHAQTRRLREWLREWPSSTPFFCCTGNHDWWPPSEHVVDGDAEGGWLRKARRPGAVFVDGDVTIVGGHRFSCWRWGNAPGVEIFGEPVVLLAHAPPAGTPTAIEFGRDIGDVDVATATVRLPPGSFVLSGHVHEPARIACRVAKAWSFNPGVGPSGAEVPNHIVIDTERRTAAIFGWGRQLKAMPLD